MAYRVGIVGLGRIAFRGFGNLVETHLGVMRHMPELKVVAGCDTDESARWRFHVSYRKPLVTDDIHAFAEVSDIVTVCTPADTHRAICEAVAQHDNVKAVLCEKPLATTVQDAEAIVKALEGKVLVVDHQRRYERCHRHLRDIVRAHKHGVIKGMVSWFSGDYLENGTHAVDLCRFIAGDEVPWSIRHIVWQSRKRRRFGCSIVCARKTIEHESYGQLAPGYMRKMYTDLIECMEHPGQEPVCSGRDGVEAVRQALFAKERDEHRAA